MLSGELWKLDRESKETCLGRGRRVVDEGLKDVKMSMQQQQQQQRHEDQGHLGTKSYVWRADASDASDLGSTVGEVEGEPRRWEEDESLDAHGGRDELLSTLRGNIEGDADCRSNIDILDVELTKAAAAWMPEERETHADASCPRRRDEALVRVNELPDLCAICLGQYAAGEQVHVLPCLHIFHAQVRPRALRPLALRQNLRHSIVLCVHCFNRMK